MIDPRYYIYRYTTASNQWCFIALDDTDIGNNRIALGQAETWIRKGGGAKYLLYHVLYSYHKANELVRDQPTRTSTHVFHVQLDDENLCTVSASHVVPNALEIRTPGKSTMVHEQIPFAQLKECIQKMMGIEVLRTTLHNALTHIIV